jgi:hypothetical protein
MVDLSRWTNSFAISGGTGSTNFLGNITSSTNPSKAVGQLYPVPNVPGEHWGNVGAAKMLIVAMGMDLGGYNAAGDFRFKIWDNSGTSQYTSDRLRTANNGTTVNLPRFDLDIVSGFSDDVLGNQDFSTPPVLETGSFIGQTTNFRFGAHVTASSSPTFNLSYQMQDNPSYQVNQDTSITSTGSFNINSTASSKSLIGRIYYVLVPTTPGTPVENTSVDKTRQIGITWLASNKGGDATNFSYEVEYQKSGDAGWTTLPESQLSNSVTITGLLNGTTYFFRVRARNITADFMTASDGITPAASGWAYSAGITTTPLPSWNDQTIASSAEAYKPFTDGVSAFNATSYTLPNSSLPPGLSLNSSTGAITGTPVVSGNADVGYGFDIRASNNAGYIEKSFVMSITGSINVLDLNGSPISGTVKVYNGSSWVSGTVYVWDPAWTSPTTGTSWRKIK